MGTNESIYPLNAGQIRAWAEAGYPLAPIKMRFNVSMSAPGQEDNPDVQQWLREVNEIVCAEMSGRFGLIEGVLFCFEPAPSEQQPGEDDGHG